VKSLIDRPRPKPSIISAKANGAILVTISKYLPSQTFITYIFMDNLKIN